MAKHLKDHHLFLVLNEVVRISVAGFCCWPVIVIGIESSLQLKIAVKMDKMYKVNMILERKKRMRESP